jgi:FkbM family methyltransferase
MNRVIKYLVAASKPTFWPAMVRGVMPAVEHIEAIRVLRPKTLIDVGANKGQFSLVARFMFPDIEVHAFEPLERERNRLLSVISEPIKAYHTALGETNGSAAFFITSRRDSSSLLRPGSAQATAYGVRPSSTVTVQVARLDDVLNIDGLRKPILMKIDVQGGEAGVLAGAKAALSSIEAIYCEASFVSLYESQVLAHELVDLLAKEGFGLRGVFNQSMTREYGPTQADFLFKRP